jgi:hypothetical protein
MAMMAPGRGPQEAIYLQGRRLGVHDPRPLGAGMASPASSQRSPSISRDHASTTGTFRCPETRSPALRPTSTLATDGVLARAASSAEPHSPVGDVSTAQIAARSVPTGYVIALSLPWRELVFLVVDSEYLLCSLRTELAEHCLILLIQFPGVVYQERVALSRIHGRNKLELRDARLPEVSPRARSESQDRSYDAQDSAVAS